MGVHHTVVAAVGAALLGATAAFGGSPMAGAVPAAADDAPGRYATDVPGINYEARLAAPCFSWERFTFGRGKGGQTLQCAFPAGFRYEITTNGYWVASYPLHGVAEIGAPCPDPTGAAAQAPDGLPLECAGARGWQIRQTFGVTPSRSS